MGQGRRLETLLLRKHLVFFNQNCLEETAKSHLEKLIASSLKEIDWRFYYQLIIGLNEEVFSSAANLCVSTSSPPRPPLQSSYFILIWHRAEIHTKLITVIFPFSRL